MPPIIAAALTGLLPKPVIDETTGNFYAWVPSPGSYTVTVTTAAAQSPLIEQIVQLPAGGKDIRLRLP
jgi:hypothetical protein